MASRSGDDGDSTSGSSFFKFFCPELTAERLRIPPKFSKFIADDIGRNFSLKGPSGNSWEVGLVENSDGFFIERGWKEFVSDHCISIGDFLLFRYAPPACFTVMVFDTTNCEKELAFLTWPSKRSCAVRPHENTFNAGNSYGSDRRLSSEGFHSNFSYKYKRTYGNSGLEARRSESSLPQITWFAQEGDSAIQQSPKRMKGSKQKTDSSSPSLALVKYSDGSQVEVLRPQRALVSQRRPVTVEELDRAIEMSRSFKSEKPFFALVMKEAYVYNSFFLHIPSRFVTDYLPRGRIQMHLWSPNGKPWPVVYLYYNGKCGFFSGGWGRFSIAHNLEKGDVCVFELIEDNNFRVHIFRVVEELTPLIRISKTRTTIVTPMQPN